VTSRFLIANTTLDNRGGLGTFTDVVGSAVCVTMGEECRFTVSGIAPVVICNILPSCGGAFVGQKCAHPISGAGSGEIRKTANNKARVNFSWKTVRLVCVQSTHTYCLVVAPATTRDKHIT
jgi:hypothetical protein